MRNYYICGFSGCGKTTLLKKLQTIGPEEYLYHDLDDLVLKAVNDSTILKSEIKRHFKDITELVSHMGWDYFRSVESETFETLLRSHNEKTAKPLILGLGGGTLDSNLEVYKKYKVSGEDFMIWCERDFDACYESMQDNKEGRPLFKLGRDYLYSLYLKRKKIYQQADKVMQSEDLLRSESFAQFLSLIHGP